MVLSNILLIKYLMDKFMLAIKVQQFISQPGVLHMHGLLIICAY